MRREILELVVDELEHRLSLLDPFVFKSCTEAMQNWNPDWHQCPVCGGLYSLDGHMSHKRIEIQ